MVPIICASLLMIDRCSIKNNFLFRNFKTDAEMLIFGLIFSSFLSVLICENLVNGLEKQVDFECPKGKTIQVILLPMIM